jgi:thiosulfate reductase cytochrome b subunit
LVFLVFSLCVVIGMLQCHVINCAVWVGYLEQKSQVHNFTALLLCKTLLFFLCVAVSAGELVERTLCKVC